MPHNINSPWAIQTTDPDAPSTGEILYPYNDASTSGQQWRTRSASEVKIVLLKHNYAATAAPTTGDDVDDGYAIGSIWVDTTNGDAYICEDNTSAAAQWLQINGSSSTDSDAIHDNVAGEIAALTEKGSPVSGDLLLIEDSADSNNKKKVQIGNLPSGGGGMTSFDLGADTGTDETVADSEVATFTGGTGIDTSVAATREVTIAIDSTVATLTGSQTLTNKTLTTPTIGDLTNATHDHTNNAGGGTLPASAIGSGTLVHERGGLEADVSAYAGIPIIESGSTTELKINRSASTAPATSNDNTEGYSVGSLWIDTTADNAYICEDASTSAAVWAQIDGAGGGSGGAWTEIVAPAALGSSQTTITFSSIPATYQDLIIVVNARGTNASSTNILMTFNNDTGSSYSYIDNGYTTASPTFSGASANNQTSIAVNRGATASTDTSGYFSSVGIVIRGYADSAFTRGGSWDASRFRNATTMQGSVGAFAWENLADAISEIDLVLDVGDFDTGTTYALYGRGTAS